jgi:hypothetical protein
VIVDGHDRLGVSLSGQVVERAPGCLFECVGIEAVDCFDSGDVDVTVSRDELVGRPELSGTGSWQNRECLSEAGSRRRRHTKLLVNTSRL